MKPLIEALHHITNFAIDIWFTLGLWQYINYGTRPTFEDLGIIYCFLIIMSILYVRLA